MHDRIPSLEVGHNHRGVAADAIEGDATRSVQTDGESVTLERRQHLAIGEIRRQGRHAGDDVVREHLGEDIHGDVVQAIESELTEERNESVVHGREHGKRIFRVAQRRHEIRRGNSLDEDREDFRVG